MASKWIFAYTILITCLTFSNSEPTRWSWNLLNQYRPHGAQCNDQQECSRASWLTCQDGLCACLLPHRMVYDAPEQKCLSKAGQPCRYLVTGTGQNFTFDFSDCVTNSRCGISGTCECDAGFYDNLDGTCVPTKLYSESCDRSVECSRPLGCGPNGTCECNRNVTEDSPAGPNKCVGLVGQPCVDWACTPNAHCHWSNNGESTTCLCDVKNFYTDENGLCLKRKGFLQPCSQNEDCARAREAQLVCSHGNCTCDPSNAKHGQLRTFDMDGRLQQSIDHCFGLVGSPCINGLCVATAYCDQGDTNVCKCPEGLITSPRSGTCVHDYGQPCSLADMEGCMEGLVCKEEVCDCRYSHHEFDRGRQACLSRVGGDCEIDEDCVQNATCKISREERKEEEGKQRRVGECECKGGFIETQDGACALGYGQICRRKGECAESALLACIQGFCQCGPETSLFSHEAGHCVMLVGGRCKRTEECVQDAECREVGGKNLKKCQCKGANGGGGGWANGTCPGD